MTDNRTERITFLVTPYERRVIESLAGHLDRTVSDTCRVVLLDRAMDEVMVGEPRLADEPQG